MKVTILGAGAMGMLFGGYLSQHNDVWLLDIDQNRTDKINADGVIIRENGCDVVFHPHAVTDTAALGEMDLVLVFVKAMYTLSALEANRTLIGKDTYLMTLQNGARHETKLLQFADPAHVIIGSTQHNSSIIENGCVNHGGGGKTSIGLLSGDSARIAHIAENFTACGFDCKVSNEVKKQIWTKLFLNTAASSLTAVLQVPLGFILDDPYARGMMEALAREAVKVANAGGGVAFDEAQVVADIESVLANSRSGYTSIYADLKSGARTEVDTISGSVVSDARELGVSVPCHEMVVNMIHALENKNLSKIH